MVDDALLGNPWLDMTALVLLTNLGMDILKPLVELALPPSRADLRSVHDAVLRALLLALNFGAIVGLASVAGALNWSLWPQYLIMAAGQAAGAHALHKRQTGGQSSGSGTAAPTQSAPPPEASTVIPPSYPPAGEAVPTSDAASA